MSNKEKAQLVPRLRFPEFKEAASWTIKQLNELLFEAKQRNRALELGPNDVLTVSGEYGCVNQIEFMGRSYAGVTVKDYHIVENRDIVYTKSPLKRSPYGIIKENKGRRGIVSTLYAVYRPLPGCSPTYLDHFFSGNYNLNSYLQPIVKKGPKNDMKVNNADVLKGNICVPEFQEQEKIADCLSSLDQLITAQARKVDALKTHKNGLMQQLFPFEGRIQPQKRFPKFQEAPDWVLTPFKQIFARVKEKNVENNLNVLTISAQDGLISQLEYFNKSVSAKDVSGYFLLRRGDFAYNKSYSQGYPMGAIKALKKYPKGVVSTLYICFRPCSECNVSFFEHYFDSGAFNGELEQIAQEGARNHGLLNIGVHDFFDKTFLFIPSPEEQKEVADCLTSINELIAMASTELDAIRTHKRGLMQQLFPSAEAAEA